MRTGDDLFASECSRCSRKRKEVHDVFVDGSAGAPKSEAQLIEVNEAQLLLWPTRPCFICDKAAPCRHRERAADLAELGAQSRRIERKPPQSERGATADRLQQAVNDFRGAGQ